MYDSNDLDIMIKFDSYIRRCIKNLSVNYDKQEKSKWYNNGIMTLFFLITMKILTVKT